MSLFFAYYASVAGQELLLNKEPATVPWLEPLPLLSGAKGYIEFAPPYSGTGRMQLRTSATVTVENKGKTVAKVRIGIGVDNPIAGAKPLYPFLGVEHGPQDNITEYETLAPGEARRINCWRVDIVDNALESDQPIAGWPNLSIAGKPLLALCGNNDTPANPVYFRDVQMDAYDF